MKKALVVPVAAAALALAPASGALAGTSSTTVLHLVATSTSDVNQPHGFSFTDVLRNPAGKKVGNDLGSCVFTSRNSADCQVGVALDGGVLAFTFSITGHQSVLHGPLVAATGVYSGASGRFRAVQRPKHTYITVWLHQ